MTENKRIQCVDITKGFSIILVVMLHLVEDAGISTAVNRVLGGYLGVFFMLSSYFYKPGKGYWFNVKKRFFQLVVPLLFYNLVVLILCYVFEVIAGTNAGILDYLKAYWDRIYDSTSLTAISLNSDSLTSLPSVLGDSIVNIVLRPSWFLNRLFCSELIFFAVADWALRDVRRVCAAIFGLLTITVVYVQFSPVHLPLQLDTCFAIAGVMLFSSYMKKLNLAIYIEKGRWDKKKLLITGAFLAAYAAAVLWLSDFFGSVMMEGKFGNAGSVSVYIWFVCMVTFFYIMLLIGSSLSHIPFVSGTLKLLGKHTLMILIFHMLFGKIFIYIAWKILGFPAGEIPVWVQLAAVAAALALSLLVSLARDRIKAKIARKAGEKE